MADRGNANPDIYILTLVPYLHRMLQTLKTRGVTQSNAREEHGKS